MLENVDTEALEKTESRDSVSRMKMRIKIEASKRGWTLTDMARELGISPQNFNSRISRDMKLVRLKQFADKFGITVGELLAPLTVDEILLYEQKKGKQ